MMNDDESDTIQNMGVRSAFLTTFSMIALAEIGDKTEIAVIALSAQYHAPALIFVGAVCALGSVSVLGVILGSKLSTVIPMGTLRVGSGILFVLFGIIFLIGV